MVVSAFGYVTDSSLFGVPPPVEGGQATHDRDPAMKSEDDVPTITSIRRAVTVGVVSHPSIKAQPGGGGEKNQGRARITCLLLSSLCLVVVNLSAGVGQNK